ncbi:ankyrin repeat-containing domain protein [Nemania sp. FL0031]|nr:ankyrin repeat-containing domain protein [Nemania sp. FL0031]
MADPVSILGGLSAGAQLLGAMAKTISTISTFCENFRHAPRQLVRIKDRLIAIQDILAEVESQVQGLTNDDILPEDMRQRLYAAVSTILADVEKLQKRIPCPISVGGSVRKRLQWATFRERWTKKDLGEITQAEACLMDIMQVLISRSVLIIICEIRQKKAELGRIQPETYASDRRLALCQINSIVLENHSTWRWMGFLGAFTYAVDVQHQWRSRLVFGFQPPTWTWLQSMVFQLDLAAPLNGASGFRITSGHLYLQNRVPVDSPFMAACQRGDIFLMKQYLTDQPWALRDKTISTGETPLLLSIKSENLQAVQWLLEQGANPNDGDDDQVLPVFATLGMQPRRRQRFVQIPSRWNSSFECFRLLVSHGASVHEVVRGKTLGNINLVSRCPSPPLYDFTVDYINLLRSENFADFDFSEPTRMSLFVNAFQSPCYGLQAIQALVHSGANVSRILDDGRTYLAIAAEMSEDIKVLKYVYENGCASYLNRQDKWGWTPLHYCVFMEWGRWHSPRTDKSKFLLDMGADPKIKAREHELLPIPTFDSDHFTPIELADHLESHWPTGVSALLRSYVREEDVFYDAMESQDNAPVGS